MRHLPRILYEKVGPFHIRVVEARVTPSEGAGFSALAVVIHAADGRIWPVHAALTANKDEDAAVQEELGWAFGIAVEALQSHPSCLDLLPQTDQPREVLSFLQSVTEAPLVGGLVVVDAEAFRKACRESLRAVPPRSLADLPGELIRVLQSKDERGLARLGLARLNLETEEAPCASDQADLN
ncbi:MAG: hypothetical protein ACK41F_09840 [Fimbriimonadaceae bacterium]